VDFLQNVILVELLQVRLEIELSSKVDGLFESILRMRSSASTSTSTTSSSSVVVAAMTSVVVAVIGLLVVSILNVLVRLDVYALWFIL